MGWKKLTSAGESRSSSLAQLNFYLRYEDSEEPMEGWIKVQEELG